MKSNRIFVILFAVFMLAAVITFSVTAPAVIAESEQSPEPGNASVSFTDLQGNKFEFAEPIKTIASGKSNLTQITLILAGETAVATAGQGVDVSEGSLMNDMFPGIQNLMLVSENDINVESLLNINPDLVLIYGNSPETDLSKQLKESGLTVAICNLANEEELLQTMNFLAIALGDDAVDTAEKYEAFYRGIMADVAEKSRDISDESKPKVAYIRGNGAVCGVNSMPQNWITAAGGINIGEMAGIQAYAAEMTAEEFLNYNPEIIFCESPSSLEFLAKDEYKNVQAVLDEKVYVVPRGLSASGLANAENLLVWQWAANIIQPEIYSYDAEQTVLDFFKTYYNYELSEVQLELVMNPAGK